MSNTAFMDIGSILDLKYDTSYYTLYLVRKYPTNTISRGMSRFMESRYAGLGDYAMG